LIIFSAGCAKRAIPDTIAVVEQTWFSFREGEITYDDLKEKIADYYIDFDQKYGDEVFLQWNHKDDQGTVLYKDLEGMSLREIAALRKRPDFEMEVVSSQVSVSAPVDAVRDQQLVFSWREDTVEGLYPEGTCMIASTKYLLSKVEGIWKIDTLVLIGSGYRLTDDEEEIEIRRSYALFAYQDEADYVQTITLK